VTDVFPRSTSIHGCESVVCLTAARFKRASNPAIKIPKHHDPEYYAPETGEAHSSFDICTMGAVLLEFLVYITEGSAGVFDFASKRKRKVRYALVADFYADGKLKKASNPSWIPSRRNTRRIRFLWGA
jgi:hypothetical protein